MRETIGGLKVCGEPEKMGWESTRAVNTLATGNIQDTYSRFLVMESWVKWHVEELLQRDVQACIDGVHRWYKESKFGLSLARSFAEIGQEHFFYSSFCDYYCRAAGVSHSLQGTNCYCGVCFGMSGFLPSQEYYDSVLNDLEDGATVAAHMLHKIIFSDHVGGTRKQWHTFILVWGKNRTK